MKLEEFEALEKAATTGPWKALPPGYRGDTVSGYMDVCAVVQLKPDELDDKYSIQDLEENDANFIAACREMAPKLIEAARASWHLVRALDGGQAIVAGSALHKLLRVTLLDIERTQTELEQP